MTNNESAPLCTYSRASWTVRSIIFLHQCSGGLMITVSSITSASSLIREIAFVIQLFPTSELKWRNILDWSSSLAVFSASLMEREICMVCAGTTLIAPDEPNVSGSFVTPGGTKMLRGRRNARKTRIARLRVQKWDVWRRKGKDCANTHMKIVTLTVPVLKKVRGGGILLLDF